MITFPTPVITSELVILLTLSSNQDTSNLDILPI